MSIDDVLEVCNPQMVMRYPSYYAIFPMPCRETSTNLFRIGWLYTFHYPPREAWLI